MWIISRAEQSRAEQSRSSNVELLKIIAMILITLSHCLPVYGNGNYAGWIDEQNAVFSLNSLLVLFLRHVGQVGNILFVICSAWFLVDNNKIKMNKVLKIMLDTFFISCSGLLIGVLCNVQFSKISIIKMLTPTTSGLNWFVGCYLLLYMVHGYLNVIIDEVSQKALLGLVATLTLLYLMLCAAMPDILYYNRLICFITVYFLIGYMKKYMPEFSGNQKKNVMLFSILICMYVTIIIAYLCLATKLDFLAGRAIKLACTNNFVMIFMDISLFNIFRTIKLSFCGSINKIASTSLVFYLITENCVLAGHLRPLVFQWIYNNCGYLYLPLWILCMNLVTLIVGILISLIYCKTIGNMTAMISKKLEKISVGQIHRFGSIIMKIR